MNAGGFEYRYTLRFFGRTFAAQWETMSLPMRYRSHDDL